ncbi:hypothetical protein [Sinomicrobium weinanense]|uniref:Uncharacterized protein n=1 Tax=Sinomicrobium weinanense TaxID=2842200 RepID=A0A926JU13_9FLAO|nr:hypothetical protein [Sinomicrobium weinanense]MBC9797535.1 hypothetical protein [Sinomicrobium weinanense]MBU3122394.1 hypothetical protein [Sinomicrobium weinanense]
MFGFKKRELTEDEKYIKEIVLYFSEKESVKKLISPISDEYFLMDDENQIYICLGNGRFSLSNHKFLYEKIFNLSFTEELKKQVRHSMEAEMQALKKSLFKNETNLLHKVLNLVNNARKAQIISPNFKNQKSTLNGKVQQTV